MKLGRFWQLLVDHLSTGDLFLYLTYYGHIMTLEIVSNIWSEYQTVGSS